MIKKRNKKAISVMIGYILLVSFALVMAVIVYTYIKTYVPKDLGYCPDETSLFIKEAVCENGNLNITLKNNGRFNIAGYFIHGSNSIDEEVAVVDMVSMLKENIAGQSAYFSSVIFDISTNNTLNPNEEIVNQYNISTYIYSIEIIPTRFQGENSKKTLLLCGKSKVEEIVQCSPQT